MSLLQWLTVSTSFRDTHEEHGRYKMTALNLVPNFGGDVDKVEPKQNSEKRANQAVQPPRPARGRTETQPRNPKSLTPRAPTTPTSIQTGNPPMKPMMMTENVSAQLETSANAANAANAAKKTYPRGRWSMTSNPWKQATSNLPVKESVQGELAMESVHPIRNSLDDSDLEFKLTSDKSNQSSKSKASGNPSGNPFRGRPQEGFWTRLKSKLKGSAKS